MIINIILTGITFAVIGLIGGWLLKTFISAGELERENDREEGSSDRREESEIEVKLKEIKEREKTLKRKKEKLEAEQQEMQLEIKEMENKLERREKDIENEENNLSKKEEKLDKRARKIEEEKTALEDKRDHLEKRIEEYENKLQRISGLTREEAKRMLMNDLKEKVRFDSAQMVREMKEDAKQKGEEEARKIIAMAILRLASEETSDLTTNEVDIPDDSLKGRIIGKNGKNIDAFEEETGVKVIVDKTPGKITISSFDSVKREIAKMCMKKLIKKKKFSPEAVRETLKNCEAQMDKRIDEAGYQAVEEVGIENLDSDLVRLMGKMKYRTSYGQNVLKHSIEVAKLTGAMAAELNLDVDLAKRAGFLHDIGKSIDREIEGTHPELGAEKVKEFDEPEPVLNAIESHHEDVEPTSIIPVLVAAADAISGSRPGARRKNVSDYVKRIEDLEHIANSVKGVANCYAIQAGREVRVIAMEDELSADELELMSTEISNRIESEMEYPGKIKVVAIREKKAVEYAN